MRYPFIKTLIFVAEPMPAQAMPVKANIVPDWIKNAKPIISEKPINIEKQISYENPISVAPSFSIPNEVEKKRDFGVELSKSPNDAFEAACRVFAETKIALWVSRNWLTDPIVNAAKDLYGKEVASNARLLSKEELADKVLEIAEDSFAEAKDRVAALKLYSEIAGYTGKVEIDASTKNFLTKNEMKVVFVKADNTETEIKKEAPVIEHEQLSPIKIKLVK